MRVCCYAGLIAAALVGFLPVSAGACSRSPGYVYYPCSPCSPCYPCYPCYPCPPCWPPDTTPLNPPPPHPVPHTTLKHTLTLQNRTYSEAFVVIYIRHPDGVYRVYDKAWVKAGTSLPAPQPNGYFAGDHLLIDTWTRGTPYDCWHCRCESFIFLEGGASTFDVIHCSHTRP